LSRVAHVGLDLAWGQGNPSGIAAVGDDGTLLASATLRTDDEIVGWIESHAPRLGVLAIDAPLIVTNPTGSRPCEKAIHAAFGRFDAGAYPANTGNPNFDPPRALTLARRLGLEIDPTKPSREGVAIEVYPHPAMIGLFRLGRTLKYKRKKQGFTLQHAETRRLLSLMEGIDPLRLGNSRDWLRVREVVEAADRPRALRKVEDEIDAVLCAHLAWMWASEPGGLELYGDPVAGYVETGYIVAPPPPTWAATPRLPPTDEALTRDGARPSVQARPPRYRRSMTANVPPSRAAIDARWAELEALMDVIPRGRWTTYGDLADVIGSSAIAVGQRIAKDPKGLYWRVLGAEGRMPDNYAWAVGSPLEGSDPADVLAAEGVRVARGRAEPSQRLTGEELEHLRTEVDRR
jgi:predicted RNase H-like nuclease/alkylated DNA nucleotide flippase Atl1